MRTPLPTTYLLGLGLDRSTTEYSRRQDSTAIFTGTLNDALFYVSPALPAVSDFVARFGWNRRALRLAYQVAILAQASVWHVLRDTLRSALRRSRRSRDLSHFLLGDPDEGAAVAANPALVDSLRRAHRSVHPWFEDVQDLPLGKLWHIWQIATFPYDDPFARAGDPITRNIEFARELLLDGALVKAQVVDRRKLEAALSQLPVRISARPSELDRYLSTEIWLQQWAAAHRMFAH